MKSLGSLLYRNDTVKQSNLKESRSYMIFKTILCNMGRNHPISISSKIESGKIVTISKLSKIELPKRIQQRSMLHHKPIKKHQKQYTEERWLINPSRQHHLQLVKIQERQLSLKSYNQFFYQHRQE